MKLTKEQLKQIIKEELDNVLEGQSAMFSQYGLQGWDDWGAKDGPRMKPKPEQPTGVVFPDYGMENVAKELQDAYNDPAGGSLSLAPNFSGLAEPSSNTIFKMEDYAYRLESNWRDFVEKIGNKDVAQNIINWIYAYHEFLNPRPNDY